MWYTNLLMTISMILWLIAIPVYLIDEWKGRLRPWPTMVLMYSALIGLLVFVLEEI